MKKRQPIILLLMIGVMGFYLAANYYLQRQLFIKNFANIVVLREKNVAAYIHLGKSFADAGMWDQLRERLEQARSKQFLDFYILQYVPDISTRKIVWYGNPGDDPNPYDNDYSVLDRPKYTERLTYETFQAGDYRLTVGIIKDLDYYMRVQMAILRNDIIRETIYFALIVLLVSLWVFRDMFAIIRKVRKGDLKQLAKMRGHSSEADQLLRGFAGVNEQVEDLQSENALYQRQVLPSLKKEIFSGKKPPYDFDCTLVRTDINGFSTIYNNHDVETFMRVINEFFVEVTHTVSRYKGLVHEFVGDEVLFYFKDEEHPNSFMIALSAVRDIGLIAEKFNARTLKEYGYPFTVKSSLAHGRVRFGPLVNGFSVAGSVLIETVRILSHVVEKEGNVVYFDKAHAGRVAKYVRVEDATRVKLKGFNEEKTLVRYIGHESLSHLLARFELSKIHSLSFYRSDDDLYRVLNHFIGNTRNYSERVVLQSLQVLRSFVVTKFDQRIDMVIRTWMRDLRRELPNDPSGKTAKILSSVVASLTSLIPANSLSKEMADELEELLKVKDSIDKRIIANAVEVLAFFEAASRGNLLRRIGGETNSRVLANTLIHDGKIELTSAVYRGLARLIDSSSTTDVASGLYAVGEIARYYRENNQVQFHAERKLQEFIQRIPKFVQNADASIRKQAFIAAQKAETEFITHSIFESVRGTSHESEALEFLGALRKAA
ncbi:MAG TPA: hypothetical protein VM432_05630 [Bdellovibrionales bacterium]|nr:hypothetical protein [Bdellovibrionales bacterium]